MNIISIIQEPRTVVTGRMSDGSDRKIETVTGYVVTVKNGFSLYQAEFHVEPTEQDIQDAFMGGQFRDITSEADKIIQLEQDQLMTKLALAELATIGEQDKLDIQLALAELAGLIVGGE